ncbi:MAG: putative transcriptional regulator [uncultured archaeon A07HB70]|jgi:Predicted transcriptional regulators|nr:MAG: putative transcriptional regulator [uncultured archaeon A07HB70]
MFDLTAFQRDLLYVIAGMDRPSGQEVKRRLEEAVGETSHGRLYPNLDTLVTEAYVEKGEIDRRTNFYQLTPAGQTALRERRAWENQFVDIDDPPEPEL